ncbi:MAG: nucleotidyltransferase domain-containing protein [Chloroflexi bacterium]|nr:nucleotidyltransferase domain-containing protein [Chloroflexota bacterium]
MPVRIKKLLKELKQGLVNIYGEQLKAVYLYGSYARGEARPDSDIDVLMVLKDKFNYIEMLKRSDDFAASFCLDNDVVISRAFVSVKEYEEKQTPFLINVRRDGVAV